MQRSAADFWVGLFVLAGLAAVLFLALQVGNMSAWRLSGGQTYRVEARFDNIGGLKPRAAVKSAGVVVGRVTSVRFDGNDFQAVVSIDLDASIKFPKDTSAKILTAGLLGEQYIGLEAGGDEANLTEGETIRATQSAVVLENLIGQFLYNKAAEGGKD